MLPLAFGIALWVSMLLAAAALFAIGAYAGTIAGRSPVLKGLEVVGFGAAVFAISWAAGHYVPPLFGHGSISVGG
jgi:VIT1/CCC1 family predicted Fe2+/Mn2+ transporter